MSEFYLICIQARKAYWKPRWKLLKYQVTILSQETFHHPVCKCMCACMEMNASMCCA